MSDTDLVVRLSICIDAPPERVWRAFVTQEAWRRWFHPGVEIEPKIGGRFRLAGVHGGRPYAFVGIVRAFETDRCVVVSWGWDPPRYAGETSISYTLFRDGKGTRVEFTHAGFEQLPDELRRQEYESFKAGWKVDEELAALKILIETDRSIV